MNKVRSLLELGVGMKGELVLAAAMPIQTNQFELFHSAYPQGHIRSAGQFNF
jgi:hypothetical protein